MHAVAPVPVRCCEFERCHRHGAQMSAAKRKRILVEASCQLVRPARLPSSGIRTLGPLASTVQMCDAMIIRTAPERGFGAASEIRFRTPLVRGLKVSYL